MPATLNNLIEKNIILETRAWKKTICELVIIVVCCVVVVLNPKVKVEDLSVQSDDEIHTKIYSTVTLNDLSIPKLVAGVPNTVLYSPQLEYTNAIMDGVKAALGLEDVIGYKNEEEMMDIYDDDKVLAAVVFPDETVKDSVSHLKVTLRFPYKFRSFEDEELPNNLWATRCDGSLSKDADDEAKNIQTDLYVREGFLQLQHQIFVQWFVTQLNKQVSDLPEIAVKSFRHQTKKEACRVVGTSNLKMFLYSFSFFLPFMNLLKKYGREREENMLAHHWRYGYSYGRYWLGHCVVSLVHLLLLDLVALIVLKIPLRTDANSGVFRETSSLMLLLFMALYNISMMLCVIVLVSLSSTALNAQLLGAVVWLSMFSLFSILTESQRNLLSPLTIISFLLFFNNTFPWGMRYLKIWHVTPMELGLLMLIMAGSGLVSAIILKFVQYASQGRYINILPLGIPLWPSKKQSKDKKPAKVVVYANQMPSWGNFEYGPLKGGKLVTLKNVGYYRGRTKKYFLKPMTLRIFKGEITVLVGPHGSGKTTLMNIIAGWKRPQTGTVHIERINMFEDWSNARDLVDVCMPNNPLFDLLTVQETLVYYLKIKLSAVDEQKIRMELDKWFELMKPARVERGSIVKNLSFEHKRLVSLCCTLCAKKRIILLDEPTISMRSPAQHLYWRILQKEKPDRAIVVATYDLEEAETIGDRIAFLNDGILQASGTPFFLKTKFGTVCDLILLKTPEAVSDPITKLINQFIPEIIPDNEIGNQLFYKLPVDKRNLYQNLLINLRKQMDNLGIIDIRVLGSELSEIYMSLDQHKNNQIIVNDSERSLTYVSKTAAGKQHTYALLYKKLLHQAPNWMPILTFFICFVLVVLIANMSAVLKARTHGGGLYLGLNVTETSRSLIIRRRKCVFIEIAKINLGHKPKLSQPNTRSMIFTKDSFNCIQQTYDAYLKTSKTVHDKFGGVEISENNYTGWINSHIFHSAPLSLNLLHNLILYDNFKDNTSVMASIVNNPIPVPLRTKISLLDQEMMHMILPIVLGVVVPVSVGCFILPLVEERMNHLLHLQRMAGVSMTKYWTVNLLWDWCTYFSYTIVYVIVLSMCTLDGFTFFHKMITMFLLDVYGFAGLTMVYLTSMFFHTSLWSAFLISVLIQLSTGIVSYIIYWDVIDNIDIFFYVFSLFPTFSLLDGISNIYTETAEQSYCTERCKRVKQCNSDNICETVPQCCAQSFFKFTDPGILTSIAYMLFSTAVCWILIFRVDAHRKKNQFRTKLDVKSFHSACYPYDDRDVVELKKRVAEEDMRNSNHKHLLVDQLEYRLTENSRELQTVSFMVDAGMCLGIYGSRCSGKSHLIRQVVAEDGFCFGDVFVEGQELKRKRRAAFAVMSYVPQDYALWGNFTPSEILRFFCMLRCIDSEDIYIVLHDLASTLDMRSYMDKRISTLTIGRRRKVSIAIALIVQYKVIVLDEPTRGLPPHTAREIWNVLRYKRFSGNAVVFSTTSSVELQALCDKVVVVDEGEMWAVGSVQYLRKKYTRGFYLEVKLKRDGSSVEEATDNLRKDSENLQRFITFLHEESELQYHIDSWFRFYVPVSVINYSNLYGAMEKNRRRLNIADYAVNQGSMEDVLVIINNIRQHRRRVSATIP